MSQTKIPVSSRALMARINRSLYRRGEKLVKATPSAEAAGIGPYAIVSLVSERVSVPKCSLEIVARELSLIEPWECVR